MLKLLKKLRRDERGNILIITAAAMPLLIGSAGLAVDTIQWTLWKRQLQRAADSAAIAGVYEYQSTNSNGTVTRAVSDDLDQNDHTWMALKSGYPQVSFPSDSGRMTKQVGVTLAVQQSLPFSAFFMSTPPTIIARATAAVIPAGGDACFQALEPTSVTGITNTGNTSITAPQCVMYSNSPSANSASAGGSSIVKVKAIAAVGGIQQSNNWRVEQYLPYSTTLPDPFADVNPDPADMNCVSDALDEGTNKPSIPAGTNCFSSLSVGPNKTLDLDKLGLSGPIYINGGNVDLKGKFKCSECTIVLTNKSTLPGATIGTYSSNAQASNDINATKTGKFQGIAIFQDRRAGMNDAKINGGSESQINGAVYFPTGVIQLNGNGSSVSLCAMFVSRRLVFNGTGDIAITNMSDSRCQAYGLPGGNAVSVVRLVA